MSENAGGPHTLAYGVTTNHVLGLEFVLPDGTVHTTGGKELDAPGYDLTGLLTGSEGTMVLVTKVIVRLMRQPEKVKTILAIYNSASDAADTVAEITARAITPVAVEMLDGEMLRMVEEATHAGYPMDAAAVLLIELEGLIEAVEEQTEQIREACERCGAREFRVAKTAEERDLLWKGRKNAFGAVGRVSPSYYVQDGVVPRTQIAPTLRYIAEVAKKHSLGISNIFHAGDGNMHPIILFNSRVPGELERAKAAGEEILAYCISVGGSITGEHGVGMEKNEMMAKLFSPDSLDYIRRFKNSVRSRAAPESRQSAAHRQRLPGNPPGRVLTRRTTVKLSKRLPPGSAPSRASPALPAPPRAASDRRSPAFRIGQHAVIQHALGRAKPHHAPRNADHRRMIRHRMHHHRTRADLHVVADPNAAQHLRARSRSPRCCRSWDAACPSRCRCRPASRPDKSARRRRSRWFRRSPRPCRDR